MLTCFLMAISALTACSSSAGQEVVMTTGQSFDPKTITISAGETVSFTNQSNEAHTVTGYQDGFPEGAEYFSSGEAESEKAARDELAMSLLSPQGSFSVTLEVPGAYRYFCIPHEAAGMTGTIVVLD